MAPVVCRVEQLAYPQSVRQLFGRYAHKPWSMWLDSGHPASTAGRFDILVADPRWRITYDGKVTRVLSRSGEASETNTDPLEKIRELLGPLRSLPTDIPFAGGAVGYLSYELGRHYENLPGPDDNQTQPLLAVGIYDWAIVVDHQLSRAMLVSNAPGSATGLDWQSLIEQWQGPEAGASANTTTVKFVGEMSSPGSDHYARAFDVVQQYITEGDCYQVNYAQRFEVGYSGDVWALYQQFRSITPAPYAAFLNIPGSVVLSSSPEQFLSLQGRQVITRPIKGTRPRADTVQQDELLREQLRLSPKDRAENLMIVDLLRNDLGKVCVPGSIKVPALFQLQSFAQVHHLVSTVEGQLAENQDAFGLLHACLPGGSITGAPKHRAMQIIDELEPYSRGVYCGSIVRIGYDGNLDSSIAIRTLSVSADRATYWAGGGIVSDSSMEAEYQESLDKAAAFFELTGTTPS